MHTLKYSQVIYPSSFNRCIRRGSSSEGYQRQVSEACSKCMTFLGCAEKISSWFVDFSKGPRSPIKCKEYLPLKRLMKGWVHLCMKHICAPLLPFARSLESKCMPLPFLGATILALSRFIRESWGRSYCSSFREAYGADTEVYLEKYRYPVSKIFKLPQFHMGADPIIMSAKWWQGCH
jgi:hypothetical protein